MSAFLEPQNLFLAAVILALLIFSSFFSSSETALTAASRVRMHAAEKDGDKRAIIAVSYTHLRAHETSLHLV